MKKKWMVAWLILAGLHSGLGQGITGRSPAGSLSISPLDSAATTVARTRLVTYDFEFSEPSGNNFLEPRETGRLRIVITNPGKVALRNVVARIIPLSAPTGITFNDSIEIGELPVNATRYAIFHFTAGENVRSQILTFQIDVHDPQGSIADSRLFTFLARARREG